MNKIGDEVKEGMNKVTSEVKDMYTEVKIQYGEKKEDIKEFISNKKFVHDLKNQMKGQLAKNLYNKAMVGGKTIAKELKNDVKNQMKN